MPDGLKVARNGYIVTATGKGVDVLDEVGTLLVRVRIVPFPNTLPNLFSSAVESPEDQSSAAGNVSGTWCTGADGLVHRFKRVM